MKKFIYVIIITLMGFFLLSTMQAKANNITIIPSDDVFITYSEQWPYEHVNMNYNNYQILFLGEFNYGYYTKYRSLLKFDLSSIPSNAIVTSASLNIYPYGGDSNTPLVELHRMSNDNWEEGTITWNNAPTSFTTLFSPNLIDTQVFDLSGNPISWNLFPNWDISEDLMDGEVTFLLRVPINNIAEFKSKEYAGYSPYLSIEYSTPVPVPGAVILVGTGLFLLFWQHRRATSR